LGLSPDNAQTGGQRAFGRGCFTLLTWL